VLILAKPLSETAQRKLKSHIVMGFITIIVVFMHLMILTNTVCKNVTKITVIHHTAVPESSQSSTLCRMIK